MTTWTCPKCGSQGHPVLMVCSRCGWLRPNTPTAPQLAMATVAPSYGYPTTHTSTSVVEPEPIPEGWVGMSSLALPSRGSVGLINFDDLARAALLHAGIEIPTRYLSRGARYIVPRWAVDAMTSWLTSRTDMGWPEFVKAWVTGLGPDVPGKPGEENDDDD